MAVEVAEVGEAADFPAAARRVVEASVAAAIPGEAKEAAVSPAVKVPEVLDGAAATEARAKDVFPGSKIPVLG